MQNTAKDEVRSLLDKLPETATFEDIQYHLYVIEKINRGIKRAETEGIYTQKEIEKKLEKWIVK